jgi:hypothetical protein
LAKENRTFYAPMSLLGRDDCPLPLAIARTISRRRSNFLARRSRGRRLSDPRDRESAVAGRSIVEARPAVAGFA